MTAWPPTDRPAYAAHLNEIVLHAEEAQVQLQKAAQGVALHGPDSSAVGRRLRGTRPVLGALRLKRLQLIAVRWRTPAPDQGTP
jgi:hypothetical protein